MMDTPKSSLAYDKSNYLNVDLPSLPSIIRYYDEFDDKYYVIEDPGRSKIWHVIIDGREATLDFYSFSPDLSILLKHWCAYNLIKKAPASVVTRFGGLKSINEDEFKRLLTAGPRHIKAEWQILISKLKPVQAISGIKSILYFLCDHNR